jgi:hypothetical protein
MATSAEQRQQQCCNPLLAITEFVCHSPLPFSPGDGSSQVDVNTYLNMAGMSGGGQPASGKK